MKKRLKQFIIAVLFLSFTVICVLTALATIGNKYLSGSEYDVRAKYSEKNVRRGNIYDRNKNILSYSETEDGTPKRRYMYPGLYSHINGYLDDKYGKTFIEDKYNNELQGVGSATFITRLHNLIYKDKSGDGIILTVDHELQKKCRRLMQGLSGAIVISDPTNGEILASYSSPEFDENHIGEAVSSENAAMLDRVRQGRYTPGSVFKIISSINLIQNNAATAYNDTGKFEVGGGTVSNYAKQRFGNVDLNVAFKNSINTYYSELGMPYVNELARLTEKISDAIVNSVDSPMFGFYIKPSENDFSNAILSIGQGKVLASPLAINTLTASIYNGGYFYSPHYVKAFLSSDNTSETGVKPKRNEMPFSIDETNIVMQAMRDTVISGTASGFGLKEAGGKTGTAELSNNRYNYSFTGYTNIDGPKIITVVIENSIELKYNKAVQIFRDLTK